MTKQTEALEMAIELTERFLEHDSISSSDYIDVRNACIKALEPTVAELNDEYLRDTYVEGLNQPTQEPVAWQALCGDNHHAYGTAEIDLKGYHSDFWQRPLFTHPKQWQGLSDDEIDAIDFPESGTATIRDFTRAIEAKLREKNDG